MTAKEQLIERAPGFSEAQAQAALSAAERQREDAFAAIRTAGDAFVGLDPAEIEAEAVKAARQARAEIAAERRD